MEKVTASDNNYGRTVINLDAVFVKDGEGNPTIAKEFAQQYLGATAEPASALVANNASNTLTGRSPALSARAGSSATLYHYEKDALIPFASTRDMMDDLRQVKSITAQWGDCRPEGELTRLVEAFATKFPIATHVLCACYMLDDEFGKLAPGSM